MYCRPSTKQSNTSCYSLGLLMTTLIISRVPEILNKYLKCNGAATLLTDLSSFKKNISGQIEILFTQYTVIEPKSRLTPYLDNSRYCAFFSWVFVITRPYRFLLSAVQYSNPCMAAFISPSLVLPL